MVNAKTDIYGADEQIISQIAKALAHPVRVKILKILSEKNACQCGQLVELLPLAQSTISQHLKELKTAELIVGEIEGPRICYCINYETLKKVSELYSNLFARLNCC